jgi:5-methylcytosine-specific restriction endonuclease McrA
MRERKCLFCREVGADLTSGVHRGRCEEKLFQRLNDMLTVAMSPERVKFRKMEAVRRSRVRRQGGRAVRLTFSQVEDRLAYYGGRCWICGKATNAMGHVIPVSRGGGGWASNLRPTCTSCKRRKRNKHPQDFGGSVVAFLAWCGSLRSRDEAVVRARRAESSLRAIGREVGLSQEGVRKVLVRSTRRSRQRLSRRLIGGGSNSPRRVEMRPYKVRPDPD